MSPLFLLVLLAIDARNGLERHSRGRSLGSDREKSKEDRRRSSNLRRRLQRSESPFSSPSGGMSLVSGLTCVLRVFDVALSRHLLYIGPGGRSDCWADPLTFCLH